MINYIEAQIQYLIIAFRMNKQYLIQEVTVLWN